jgi:hypothetical protein
MIIPGKQFAENQGRFGKHRDDPCVHPVAAGGRVSPCWSDSLAPDYSRSAPFEGEPTKVPQELTAIITTDGFRVKLDPPQRSMTVPKAHQYAVVSPGGGYQFRWELSHHEWVVSHRGQWWGETFEKICPTVAYFGNPAVHRLRCVMNLGTKAVTDLLKAQADPQHREVTIPNDAAAYPDIPGRIGSTGSRADYDAVVGVELEVIPVGVIGDNHWGWPGDFS